MSLRFVELIAAEIQEGISWIWTLMTSWYCPWDSKYGISFSGYSCPQIFLAYFYFTLSGSDPVAPVGYSQFIM
jgi:hypothetical protein